MTREEAQRIVNECAKDEQTPHRTRALCTLLATPAEYDRGEPACARCRWSGGSLTGGCSHPGGCVKFGGFESIAPVAPAPVAPAPVEPVACVCVDLDMAWTLIAHVSHGDWGCQSADWQKAAIQWREGYHKRLSARTAAKEAGR